MGRLPFGDSPMGSRPHTVTSRSSGARAQIDKDRLAKGSGCRIFHAPECNIFVFGGHYSICFKSPLFSISGKRRIKFGSYLRFGFQRQIAVGLLFGFFVGGFLSCFKWNFDSVICSCQELRKNLLSKWTWTVINATGDSPTRHEICGTEYRQVQPMSGQPFALMD
ncbi:hypothetical protein CEXT_208511 [Caerostris extrusa]|uniref:Uncharacterized protein n=1 Tax=Caerostris extrusa TaxID=172846 RepID=A0AAV4XR35_CAEEX|nr:hypothetical protein CEXT_208511 [Caerostris extrusa]